MKHLMSSKLLIAFVMVLCWNSVKASDFITVDGFKYYVDTTKGEATILANDYEGDIVIPSVVVFEDKDYAVTTIGKNAFKNCNIQSVILGKNISTLEEGSFMGASLRKVSFPSQLINIGKGCFKGCQSLLEVTMGDGITTIPASCFEECVNLNKINLPPSITEIGYQAFMECRNLNEIILPNSVVKVGEGCFFNCSKIQKLSISSSLMEIPGGFVNGCSSLSEISIPNSVVKIGGCAFANTPIKKIDIPQSVSLMANQVFANCNKLVEILCHAVIPPAVYDTGYSIPIFDSFENINSCVLFVPKESVDSYKNDKQWRNFLVVKSLDGGTEEQKSCSIPSISYIFGTLSFESSTPGAEYHYTINDSDVATDKYNTDGKVQLNGKLDISVYAIADGYKASDKATATLYWLNAEGGDDTNNINLVKTRGVMVTTDSDITISGLNDGEVITFFSVNGVNLGSAKAVQGVLHFAKPNESIVIAKIKGNDLKIAIK